MEKVRREAEGRAEWVRSDGTNGTRQIGLRKQKEEDKTYKYESNAGCRRRNMQKFLFSPKFTSVFKGQ